MGYIQSAAAVVLAPFTGGASLTMLAPAVGNAVGVDEDVQLGLDIGGNVLGAGGNAFVASGGQIPGLGSIGKGIGELGLGAFQGVLDLGTQFGQGLTLQQRNPVVPQIGPMPTGGF